MESYFFHETVIIVSEITPISVVDVVIVWPSSVGQYKIILRDIRFSQRCSWDFRSSGV
jgi:hypothetical protein